jgi:hypothetical protein
MTCSALAVSQAAGCLRLLTRSIAQCTVSGNLSEQGIGRAERFLFRRDLKHLLRDFPLEV